MLFIALDQQLDIFSWNKYPSMDSPSSINVSINDTFIYFLLSYEDNLMIYFHIKDSDYFAQVSW